MSSEMIFFTPIFTKYSNLFKEPPMPAPFLRERGAFFYSFQFFDGHGYMAFPYDGGGNYADIHKQRILPEKNFGYGM